MAGSSLSYHEFSNLSGRFSKTLTRLFRFFLILIVFVSHLGLDNPMAPEGISSIIPAYKHTIGMSPNRNSHLYKLGDCVFDHRVLEVIRVEPRCEACGVFEYEILEIFFGHQTLFNLFIGLT